MSGPKSGSYQVVSPEELERRALAAAQDRYSRANATRDSVLNALSAYSPGEKASATPAGATSREVNSAALSLEQANEELAAQLVQAQVADALGAMVRIRIDLPMRDDSPLSSTDPTVADDSMGIRQRSEALVQRTLEEVGPAAAPEMRRDLQRVMSATTPTQSRLAYSLLGKTAQRLRDEHRYLRRWRKDRDAVLSALDGCTGSEASAVRAAVDFAQEGSRLPVSLAQASDVAKRDRASQDAQFVREKVADVLTSMGYESRSAPQVSVPDSGALLELEGHPRHIVRLLEHHGQLLFNVVGVGQSASPTEDAAAERDACEVWQVLSQRLTRSGVRWTLERQDAPGQTPVARTASMPETLSIRPSEQSSSTKRRRHSGEREVRW